MRAEGFVTVVAAVLMTSACATDRPTAAQDTPPTPFTVMTGAEEFGVSHRDRSDGWTEIFVQLNESSTARRAQDMAWYYAAWLGRQRDAKTLYVSRETPGLTCRVTGRREPSTFAGGGDPFSAVAVLAFVAVYSLVAPANSWAGSPNHRLHVYFSDSEQPAHGITPLSVNEILETLTPRFAQRGRSGADGTGSDTASHSEAHRERWRINAEANSAACSEQQTQPERTK